MRDHEKQGYWRALWVEISLTWLIALQTERAPMFYTVPTSPADPEAAALELIVRFPEEVLHDCAQNNLPMICANPDLQVIRGGVRVLCAGSLALRYQELGGDARKIAPWKPIGQIEKHARGKPGFRHAQEKSHHIETDRSLYQRVRGGQKTPCGHDAENPTSCPDPLKDHIGWHLEQ